MSYLSTASTISESYVDTSLSKVTSLISNPEIQAKFKELGINISPEDLTLSRLKAYLSAVGLYALVMYSKSNIMKIATVASVGYVYLANKKTIQGFVTENTGYVFDENVPTELPTGYEIV